MNLEQAVLEKPCRNNLSRQKILNRVTIFN